MSDLDTDVLIIGGGPAGACAALYLAKQGIRSRIIEKDSFPRFHVGESLLPSINPMLAELGLLEPLAKADKVPKNGAEIVMGWQETGAFLHFKQGEPWGEVDTFNIERAVFDKVLLDHAAEQDGVEVRQGVAVTGIDQLRDDFCRVRTAEGEMTARLVLDCTGQGTLLGRTLKSKKMIAEHRKVAFMGHFENVHRLTGDASGFISLVMANDAWFWMIPIDQQRTSIGMVMDKSSVSEMRRQGVSPGGELAWALPRVPCLARRLTDARFPESNGTVADFSYHCTPGAGPGYMMVGDAEAFLDPVFSSGLYLALAGARDAAQAAASILQGGDPEAARTRYLGLVADRKKFFFHYINLFYSHPFRELLLEGKGPLGVHRALVAVLSGRCEKIPLGMRWRLGLLNFFHRLQKNKARAVPASDGWSILRNERTERDVAIKTLQGMGHG